MANCADIRRERPRASNGTFASRSEEEFWELLWDQVDRSGECWIWLGGTDSGGYGVMKHRGRDVRVHRLTLIASGVDLPDDLDALHKCDQRRCVRPGHLYPGTQADNIRDCIERGRFPYLAPRPGELHNQHKLTERDVIEAKRRRASGESFVSIAGSFGVCRTTIEKAVKGETWRHLIAAED